MSRHRLLARQLQRELGLATPEQEAELHRALEALAAREGGSIATALRGLRGFIGRVERGYAQYDRDLGLATRSLEISSDELMSANERMRADVEVQQRALVHLRDAFAQLAQRAGLVDIRDDESGLESLSQRLGALVTAHDLARQELEHSEAKFRALTALSTDWFWEQDAQLRFIATSGHGDNRAGLSAQAHLGLQHWELPNTEPLSGDWSAHRACLEARQPFRNLMLRRLDAEGRVHYIEVQGEPLFDIAGAFTGYRGTARDVTANVEAAEALREAKQAADAANAAKSLFLANMSHELRTPLNGLLGMAELLQDDELTPSQHERVQILIGSGRLLMSIINDILDFSKVEAGHLNLDHAPFDLRATIADVLAAHRPAADGKGIELQLVWQGPSRPWLVGDAVRVKQVLGNLIGNAIKFTDKGCVTLQLCVDDGALGEPASLRLVLIDSGAGIPAEAMPRLFQPFSQANAATTRRHGGTGLGLAICKRIVELMGGRIELRSELHRGTEVEVRLALPRITAPSPVSAPVAPVAWPRWPGQRVLLAEDNQVNLIVATSHLERLGLRVTPARDGIEALAALDREPFDLVLMDCQMPGMDGFEAVARWRARERVARTLTLPIVALTANAMIGDRERMLASGFSDHLGKPFARRDLVDVLTRWLGAVAVEPASA